jgi:transposase
MKAKVRFLDLDVHASTTIAVAVAEPNGSVREPGHDSQSYESIRALVKKLGPVEQLRACYEAGPTSWRSWASRVK